MCLQGCGSGLWRRGETDGEIEKEFEIGELEKDIENTFWRSYLSFSHKYPRIRYFYFFNLLSSFSSSCRSYYLFLLVLSLTLALLSVMLAHTELSSLHYQQPLCVCVVCRRAGQRFEPPPAVGSRRVTLCVHSLHLRLQRRQVTSMTPWRPPPSPPSTRLPGPDVHRPCTLLPGYAS